MWSYRTHRHRTGGARTPLTRRPSNLRPLGPPRPALGLAQRVLELALAQALEQGLEQRVPEPELEQQRVQVRERALGLELRQGRTQGVASRRGLEQPASERPSSAEQSGETRSRDCADPRA